MRIGLISDTHNVLRPQVIELLKTCDEIWHAGDLGSDLLAAKFEALKPFRAVYGNIDGQAIRLQYPKVAHFKVEDVNVMMTHIGVIRAATIPRSAKNYTIHGQIYSSPDIRIS